MPDAEFLALIKLVKQTKTKKLFFAFVPKGPEGKLLIAKMKIPPKTIAETKKEIGGGVPIIGRCCGIDGGSIAFEVLKEPPSTFAAALKKVIKKDAGLTMDPEVRISGKAEDDDEEESPATAATAKPAAPTPTPTAGKTPADAAGAKAAADGPDAGKLAAWTKARDAAIKDLKALAAKVAATKHGSAVGVIKEINSLITRLPAKPAHNEIAKLETFIMHDDTMAAAHEVPAHFHKLDIRKPLLDALNGMKT